jgi:hypothetical protein
MPRDFVLWMSGALKVLGDRAPTPQEWEQIKQAHAETVGQMVADKMNPDSQFETYVRIIRDYQTQLYGHTSYSAGGSATTGYTAPILFGGTSTSFATSETNQSSATWTDSSCTNSPCCGSNCS